MLKGEKKTHPRLLMKLSLALLWIDHFSIGLQDMLAWVKKRRRTIRREDLISFLCGKAPPHRSSRANPRLAMLAPSRANSPAETGSSVEADLQPFREAIALHGELHGASLVHSLHTSGHSSHLIRYVIYNPGGSYIVGNILDSSKGGWDLLIPQM